MKAIYTDITQYNTWANHRLAKIIKTFSKEQFEQQIDSSFPSIRATMLHIWDAEVIWHQRMKGLSLTAFPSTQFDGTQEEAVSGWLFHSAEFEAFIAKQPPSFFEQPIDFFDTKGTAYQRKAWEIIHHCMNHSTYHRGQLVTFFRQVGLAKIPSTDYIFYLRSKQ